MTSESHEPPRETIAAAIGAAHAPDPATGKAPRETITRAEGPNPMGHDEQIVGAHILPEAGQE